MHDIRSFVVGLMLVTPLVSLPAFATIFYVDGARGLDSRPGTAAAFPKKTIQSAINAALHGDEIHVAPGTYAPIEVRKRLTIIAPYGRDRTPETTTASANGANGMIAIEATPDLPWTATSQANWLTIYDPYATGAGNGNVAYTASPNTTVYEREGTITVTPDENSGLSSYTHKVTQPAANVAISSSGYEFAAPGESTTVTVTVAKNVEWSVDGIDEVDWLGITGSKTSFVGTQTITLTASANDSVYAKSGSIVIAGKTFAVSQKARGVEVDDYFQTTFDEEGGSDVIQVSPDGDVEWMAVSSDPERCRSEQGYG